MCLYDFDNNMELLFCVFTPRNPHHQSEKKEWARLHEPPEATIATLQLSNAIISIENINQKM